MRVVVAGGTGNLGTSVLEALSGESRVDEVLVISRRPPAASPFSHVKFVRADIAASDLVPLFAGAAAVVHLAWLIQPGRDEAMTEAVNVTGSRRLFDAAVRAGVPSLLYASSVGAYSPGPKDRPVDESWPTEGTRTSFYARHKAAVERILDRLEHDQPKLRVVRMRPGLVFKRQAATEIRRLFIGPLLPSRFVSPALIPIVPDVPRLRFQAVHSLDVGQAFRQAIISDVRGAFNLAADPPIDGDQLAQLLRARTVKVPASVLRAAAAVTYKLRLQPSEPGWLDMALAVPLMDTTRARTELGWTPTRTATDALAELLDGLRAGADYPTPPLATATSGRGRVHELLSGMGKRP